MTKRHWQRQSQLAGSLLVATVLVILQACTPTESGVNQSSDTGLGFGFLQGSAPLLSPQPTLLFLGPEKHTAPPNRFEGLLTLNPDGANSRIEVIKDTFGVATNESLKIIELPSFSVSFVSDGTSLIPLEREPQRNNHPYWELIAEPGLTFDMVNDNGWSRAVLPFTLKEINQNCLHNGLMTFLYKGDGSTSRVAWQITSETCLYFKANLWGTTTAEYQPQSIPLSAEIITAYRKEVASRLPVKPISELTQDYPDLELAAFQPPGVEHSTVYGLVINGIHFRSDCPTRFGPYPFCEVLDLPSYSLAKSLFGSLAYQLLIRQWPEFASTPVSSLIPECKTSDKRWDDVTPRHLLNMTTGFYNSSKINVDDDAEKMQSFFLAESHNEKVSFSCKAWPRKSKPGAQWAYHTSDTYLLGVTMNVFLKQQLGAQADIYRDLLYPQIFRHLGLSPLLGWTQRTYDKAAQPFTGYGLVIHADDVARLAYALNSDQSLGQFLEAIDFAATIASPDSSAAALYDTKNMAYDYGFWGLDASKWMTCPEGTWIPFMSGYGGISVAMFPDGSVYYYFTDSNQHGFRNAAVEANKALNYCKE